MAYAYSALVKRRTVTRPGSPPWPASYSPSDALIQDTACARSASAGAGMPTGGIWRVSSMSATFCQVSACAPTSAGAIRSVSWARLSPACGLSPPWHITQYWWKVSRDVEEARWAAVAGAGPEGSRSRPSAERADAIARNEMAQ